MSLDLGERLRVRAAEPWQRPWVATLVYVGVVYLASRLLVLMSVAAAARLAPGAGFEDFMARYDAAWLLRAAEDGYPQALPVVAGPESQSTIAFFPGMPLLIRAVAAMTGQSFVVAGVMVSVLAGFGATLLLYLFVRRLADEPAARRAAVLFCFFPTSYVYLLVYSEGLTLVCAVGCLWALVDQRWAVAGALAGLATAVRPTGSALVLCCAWAAGERLLRHRDPRALVAPALAPLGVLAYFGWLWQHTGSPTAWFTVERLGWGQSSDFGVTTLKETARLALGMPHGPSAASSTIALAVALVGLYAMVRWRPPVVLWIYTGAMLFLTFSTVAQVSRLRFVAAAFPLIVAVAVLDKRQLAYPLLVAGAAGALCVSTVLVLASAAYTP